MATEASAIRYTWNNAAGRFVAPSGQFVSLAEVRAALDRAIVTAAAEAKGIAKLLEEGTIGYLDFLHSMQALIKDTQIYATAVAAGGYSNITTDNLIELTNSLTEQYAFLVDWVDQLYDKITKAEESTLARMEARAAMYVTAARPLFYRIYTQGQGARGYNQERNVLHPAEHCDLCLHETDRDWVSLGALIPIGQRTCLSNDKCSIEYRRVDEPRVPVPDV